MLPCVQSSLPVVSIKHFLIGPDERLSVQDFLRDVVRSRRKAAVVPDCVQNAESLSQPHTLRANVSSEGLALIPHHSAVTKGKSSQSDRLHHDIAPGLEGFRPKSAKIVHTYSKKAKGRPSSQASIRQQMADFGEQTPPSSRPKVVQPARPEIIERTSRRAIRGKTVNAEEKKPSNGKKSPRRAPVEGLVLVQGVPIERAFSTASEVSQFFAVSIMLSRGFSRIGSDLGCLENED